MNADELRNRADRFSIDIVRFCRSLRLARDRETDCIADQLRDAGTSMAANYHAVCRARSHKEFFAKLCIVVEETDESVMWLKMLKESA